MGQKALGGKGSEERLLLHPLWESPCPAAVTVKVQSKLKVWFPWVGASSTGDRRWWSGLSCEPAPSVIAVRSLALETSRPFVLQPSGFQEMASLDHG